MKIRPRDLVWVRAKVIDIGDRGYLTLDIYDPSYQDRQRVYVSPSRVLRSRKS